MQAEQSSRRVLVILVNWKRAQDTLACVESLLQSTHQDMVIAVCDNASPDNSHEAIRQGLCSLGAVADEQGAGDAVFSLPTSPIGILLMQSGSNLGFAGGNNHGYRQAIARFGKVFSHVWFLNNDTEQEPSCLEAMLAKLDRSSPKVGICGATLVYAFDRRTVQALGGSSYRPWTGLMQEIGNGTQWPSQVDEAAIEARLSYVCGASMLVSAALIDTVGLMEEDYFLFFEEIDWCQRAQKAGYLLAYAHDAVVYHKEGASIGTGKGHSRSLLAEYFGVRNKMLITRRFFPWALAGVWILSWLQALRRLTQGRPRHARLMAMTLLGFGHPPK
jgi:GT2 family glycosyltransferase